MQRPSRELTGDRSNRGDEIFRAATLMVAGVFLLLPVMMLEELSSVARPVFERFGFGFLGSSDWDPVREEFGGLPFLHGTLVTSFLALLIAGPLSVGIAIYLSELAAPVFRRTIGLLVELLAAIPSVVYGFWGIYVLVPLLREHVQPWLQRWLGFLPIFQGTPIGFGLLAASVVLAIMIVPTIASLSREVLLAVPAAHREAAVGLGATRWDTIRYAVLPSAKGGIVGAVILGLGRALGETMAVTMVIGNQPKIQTSLFEPAYSMASVIANEFAEANSSVHLAALSAIALLLFSVALVLNLLARALIARRKGAR